MQIPICKKAPFVGGTPFGDGTSFGAQEHKGARLLIETYMKVAPLFGNGVSFGVGRIWGWGTILGKNPF